MKTQDELAAQIETQVVSRDPRSARVSIRKWLRGNRSAASALRASEWLRRLGLYSEAFRVLDPQKTLKLRVATGALEGRRLLAAAHLLNQMGASPMALNLARKVEASAPEEFRILGHIYLDNFESATAVQFYEKMDALQSHASDYHSRLARISLADAYSSTGEFDRAIATAEQVLSASSEPLLVGICRQAIGEFHARAGRFQEAWHWISAAERDFPDSENTIDRVLLWKWKAFVAGKLGKPEEASRVFSEAEQLYFRSELRIEVLLDIWRLEAELGMLPVERLRLLRFFPGLQRGFLARLPGLVPESMSENTCFPAAPRSPASKKILIDLRRGEFEHQGKLRLGLPLEIQLLAAARIAAPFGLATVRAKAILWSEEFYSFLALENRLQALLHRLRAYYKMDVRVESGKIMLAPGSEAIVEVHCGKLMDPSFLEARGERPFGSSEFREVYGLSSTQAKTKLNDLISEGRIARNQAGKNTKYRRL